MKNNHIKKSSASKRSKQSPPKGSTTPKAGTEKKPTLPPNQAEAVEEITRIHDEVREATRLTTVKAIDLGGRLAKLRTAVGHGAWLLFVQQHLPFCAKTAERYMKVHHNRAQLEKFDNVSKLKVSEAYELLSTKKPASGRGSDEEGGDGAAEASETSALITGISRSLCDGLDDLLPDKLKQFETDLLQFKKTWLEQHAGEVEK